MSRWIKALRRLVGAILPATALLALAHPSQGQEIDPWRRIVISLADRRLYLMEPGAEARSFPVAIGRPGVAIPLGDSAVIRKRRNPTWHPTAQQRRAKPSLPFSVPPGPGNPLGKFALDLGWTAIAIHGTNEPDSVGRRASSGCFRMLPSDIETLFAVTDIGTPVRVVSDSMGAGAGAVAAVVPVATKAPPKPAPVRPATPTRPVPVAPAPMLVEPAPPLPDPRCGAASAPLRRLICDTPALAALDGRARGLQERFLASQPEGSAAAYALVQDERRFDDRIAALCWVRRGTEGDPSVAAAAQNCLSNALSGRLDDVARRIAEFQGVTRLAGRP